MKLLKRDERGAVQWDNNWIIWLLAIIGIVLLVLLFTDNLN